MGSGDEWSLTGRQADGWMDRQTHRQAGRQAGSQDGRQTESWMDTQAGRRADKQTGRQAGRQRAGCIDRQADRQMDALRSAAFGNPPTTTHPSALAEVHGDCFGKTALDFAKA